MGCRLQSGRPFFYRVSKVRQELGKAQAANPPWREDLNSGSRGHGQAPGAPGQESAPAVPNSGTGQDRTAVRAAGKHPEAKSLRPKVYTQKTFPFRGLFVYLSPLGFEARRCSL